MRLVSDALLDSDSRRLTRGRRMGCGRNLKLKQIIVYRAKVVYPEQLKSVVSIRSSESQSKTSTRKLIFACSVNATFIETKKL